MDNNIICPKCGEVIALTEALTSQIESNLKIKYESAYKTKARDEEARLRNEITKSLNEKYLVDFQDVKKQLEEKEKKINEYNQKELELRKRERDLSAKAQTLEAEYQTKIDAIKKDIAEKAKQEALKANSLTMNDMKNQIDELKGKLASSQTKELELLKKQRELEEKKREFEIEKEKQLLEEREQIAKDAKNKSDEENGLRIREKEELIKSMQQTIEELKKKSERGSQQLQGEVQELALEEFLKATFPFDDIQPVPKGLNGADVIQVVKNNMGQVCGSIIWESKRTKTWSNDWTKKLKDDMRAAKANIPVIVSQVLPKEIVHIGQIDNVWIVSFQAALGIATALREQLLAINKLQKAEVGKSLKMESLYQYLCSNEFKQRIEGIVEAFTTMKTDLDAEKRALERLWSKREKQIEGVIKNTTGMYGDLQGLIGSALPEVTQLEWPSDDANEVLPENGELNFG